MHKRISLLLIIGILFSCIKDLPIIIGCTDSTALNYNSSATYNDGSCIFATPYFIMSPSGFPNISIPENNPMTVEGIALGKKLFHDKILSGDGTQSCASCHLQIAGFSDTNRFSQGIDGSFGNRNASTIINLDAGDICFLSMYVTSGETRTTTASYCYFGGFKIIT